MRQSDAAIAKAMYDCMKDVNKPPFYVHSQVARKLSTLYYKDLQTRVAEYDKMCDKFYVISGEHITSPVALKISAVLEYLFYKGVCDSQLGILRQGNHILVVEGDVNKGADLLRTICVGDNFYINIGDSSIVTYSDMQRPKSENINPLVFKDMMGIL